MATSLDSLPRQLGAVAIRNESIEVVVLVNKGADIYSLIDRRTGTDVLFKSPWGARQPSLWSETSTSLERWISAYAGGWQLLLPNGGNECVEQGVTWGFHGEAAMIPWTVLEQRDDALTLETSLITCPLRVRRELSLSGSVLRVREIVTNESSEDVEVMWSHHPAFGAPFLDGTCILSVGCRTVHADDAAPGTLLSPDSRHDWPMVTSVDGDAVDLRVVPDPGQPRAVLAYLKDFTSGFFAITNPTLGLGVGIRWPLEVFDQAWLWQEIHSGHGWPWFQRAYVIAVEPASTIPGQGIQNARTKGEDLATLRGRESREVVIEAVLFEGSTAVEGITEGGVVKFATP
jgi:hypothetical protein